MKWPWLMLGPAREGERRAEGMLAPASEALLTPPTSPSVLAGGRSAPRGRPTPGRPGLSPPALRPPGLLCLQHSLPSLALQPAAPAQ